MGLARSVEQDAASVSSGQYHVHLLAFANTPLLPLYPVPPVSCGGVQVTEQSVCAHIAAAALGFGCASCCHSMQPTGLGWHSLASSHSMEGHAVSWMLLRRHMQRRLHCTVLKTAALCSPLGSCRAGTNGGRMMNRVRVGEETKAVVPCPGTQGHWVLWYGHAAAVAHACTESQYTPSATH